VVERAEFVEKFLLVEELLPGGCVQGVLEKASAETRCALRAWAFRPVGGVLPVVAAIGVV